ncbi:MAG: HD domain-containing protein [Spirochaetaceae bacterium]|nr:HD domain-containing protein [Spirochaetaceae bacterium]
MIFFFHPKKINIPAPLKEIAAVFQRHNKKAFLVGGAVRDIIRGKPASDWDIATDALASEVSVMFTHVIPTGIKHGTVTVRFKGYSVEVTTFRTESNYTDGRRPDTIKFISSIEEDLSRRDFTMNAIGVELPSGRIFDLFKGITDIKKKIIRCVGLPLDRFAEDGLRPMRALRFASVLGFSLDKELLSAIPQRLDVTSKVSPERIRDEFEKIIMSKSPEIALHLMKETGLLSLILPELAACAGVEQKGYHHFDVFTHSLLACSYAAAHNSNKTVRLAALFHDIGKPQTAKSGQNGIWTFYSHEQVSAKLTRTLMFRLRFPNSLIDNVVHLIEEHMFHYEDIWSDAAVRRFLIRVGENSLDDLFELRAADTYGLTGVSPPPDFLTMFQERIEKVREKSSAFSLKDLAINGKDIIQQGIPSGKRLGVILKKLFEAVLEDPAMNNREKLMDLAQKYHERL